MSSKLNLIARMAARQTPEKIPVAPASDDLAAAIERLVQERVDQALAQQPERQPVHVQRLLDRQFNKPLMPTSFEQLPVVQKTAPAKNLSMQLHRDAGGVIRWMECCGQKFRAVRDSAGVLLGIEQVDESPVLPPPDIPFKASARQYQPGEPR